VVRVCFLFVAAAVQTARVPRLSHVVDIPSPVKPTCLCRRREFLPAFNILRMGRSIFLRALVLFKNFGRAERLENNSRCRWVSSFSVWFETLNHFARDGPRKGPFCSRSARDYPHAFVGATRSQVCRLCPSAVYTAGSFIRSTVLYTRGCERTSFGTKKATLAVPNSFRNARVSEH